MIVIDASVIVEILLRTTDGIMIFERLAEDGRSWHAPYLIDVEVTQVLRRYAAQGSLPPARAAESLQLLRAMPVRRYAHEPLLDRMWALRSNLTMYDAAYVALAEGLRTPLVTRDRKLAAAPGLVAGVELV